MLKYLLLIAIGVVVWWAWRQRNRPGIAEARREIPPEPMVTCAHCGVYLPQSESLAEGGRHYCSEAHREAGRRPPSP